MARQLPLPLEVRPALTREGFIAAPSNEAALRFILRWPDWPVRAVALFGPEGAGKTHLAEIWRAASGAEIMPAGHLSADWLALLAPAAAVAVEDVDSASGEERDRALFALFERRTGTLLLTGRTPPAEWAASSGDLKSRFASVLAIPVGAPDDALLGGLARKLFADRQLSVSDNAVRLMLLSLERTPAAVSEFVARADAKALAERRPVSERLVLELLEELERR